MTSQAEKISHHFLDIINDSTGLKVTELVTKVTIGIHEDTEINPKPTGDEVVAMVNKLIKSGQIIEIDYTVPTMDWRIKSFLLPKDSKIVSITNQPQTLEINEKDFQVLSHWASTTRTINEAIRLLYEYKANLTTSETDTYVEEIEFNISELEALRPIFENLNQKAKDIAFLKAHKSESLLENIEQAINRSKREISDPPIEE